jgi:hypothetical protein
MTETTVPRYPVYPVPKDLCYERTRTRAHHVSLCDKDVTLSEKFDHDEIQNDIMTVPEGVSCMVGFE